MYDQIYSAHEYIQHGETEVILWLDELLSASQDELSSIIVSYDYCAK
jgi:hypothetical protein